MEGSKSSEWRPGWWNRGREGKGREEGWNTAETGTAISMECNIAEILLAALRLCSHSLSLQILHTNTHTHNTHTQGDAINLPVSTAGIETPKTGLCCVWRECRCTCLQHIILGPSSSPSLCSSPPLLFILSISLHSSLSHVLNPFQP